MGRTARARTPQQYQVLADLDCGLGQGYLLSRPLAAHDATDLLLSGVRLGQRPRRRVPSARTADESDATSAPPARTAATAPR